MKTASTFLWPRKADYLRALFMKRVEMIPEAGCWIWLGPLATGGYGTFGINKYCMGAHRASYELFRGRITDSLLVCHSCDVRCCVNPKHLFLGTQVENLADMYRKGRREHPLLSHCYRGHEYTEENTYWHTKTGARQCHQCKKITNRNAYLKKIGEKNGNALSR